MNLLASLRRRARAFKNANMPFSNSSSLADAKFSFLIFYTPYFSHSAYSTLFVSHNPHFPYSSFSIFLIFHTHHFPSSSFSIFLIFPTHLFPYSTFSKFLLFQSRFSRWEKIYCPHVNVSWQERHWNQATFLIGDCIKYSLKRIYNYQNHFTLQKVKNTKHFVSPAPNLAPKLVVPLLSPGRIIVVLFWTKCAIRRQIKSGIL